jgi:hypothetical protein
MVVAAPGGLGRVARHRVLLRLAPESDGDPGLRAGPRRQSEKAASGPAVVQRSGSQGARPNHAVPVRAVAAGLSAGLLGARSFATRRSGRRRPRFPATSRDFRHRQHRAGYAAQRLGQCALLVLQVLLAWFAVPLQLFRELPISVCWRRSILAMQLNPWLLPTLGLVGLALLVLPFFDLLAIPAQLLALPLPVYVGALLYVAWNDVFQGGAEEEEIVEIQDRWRASVSGEPASRQSRAAPHSDRRPAE